MVVQNLPTGACSSSISVTGETPGESPQNQTGNDDKTAEDPASQGFHLHFFKRANSLNYLVYNIYIK